MNEHVRLERSHEQESGGPRILHAEHTGRLGALEVFGHDLKPAPGRGVGIARIEREDDRRLGAGEHVDGQVLRNRPLHEGDELLREATEHHARIRRRVGARELENELGNLDPTGLHGGCEERLFAGIVPQHRGRRHLHFPGDVCERRRLEPLVREDPPRRIEKTFALDDRRSPHL